ncbi:aspartate/glutamate racemase family protein [Amycolatopsis vancoresmycina]|uniref:Glutamate racemase n=1 Tax=Amycolatopsis vancoresmycina DSM 44592 TaxID=1292037 RepID=R1HH92_9PSEU|nr:aspartate/glutamate racemase family protein [Amycolatopsis vancoresmycina]EOD62955.1 glutamate racemase [Amycolatopsis vancoresmycina DSM 44592]
MAFDGGPFPVAVIAGTPYDSGLGAELLREAGLPARPHAMAGSPDEQDALQYQDPAGLAAAFHRCLAELRDGGTGLAMLFCNSLSAVVDHDDAAVPVISPVTVYRELLPKLGSSLVVTGNAQAVLGVERTAWRTAPGHRMLGVSDPALVRGIEAGDPEAAFAASHLPTTLRLAERLGLDAVVLACTHFTTVLPFVTAACDLPVFDVGSRLVELTTLAATGSENHA